MSWRRADVLLLMGYAIGFPALIGAYTGTLLPGGLGAVLSFAGSVVALSFALWFVKEARDDR